MPEALADPTAQEFTKVMKFGGTSMRDHFENVQDIAIKAAEEDGRALLVVSALAGVTDRLHAMAAAAQAGNIQAYRDGRSWIDNLHMEKIRAEIEDEACRHQAGVETLLLCGELEHLLNSVSQIKVLPPQTLDQIVSFGERLSAVRLKYALKSRGQDVEIESSADLVKTDKTFGGAEVQFDDTNVRINTRLSEIRNKIIIATGYFGSHGEGEDQVITSLGRGASDYVAAIIAGALGVPVYIYTDVPGVMEADPRIVPEAKTIPKLTYNEAGQLSTRGAKVLHAKTMGPVDKKGLPIYVKSTAKPELPGTIISAERNGDENVVKGISVTPGVTILNVTGFNMQGKTGVYAKITRALEEAKISIISSTQVGSETEICFAVDPADGPRAEEVLNEVLSNGVNVKMVENQALLSIVGENMENSKAVLADMANALARNGISIKTIAQGASEHNITVAVPADQYKLAVDALHNAFFQRRINIILFGNGTVGSEYARQVAEWNADRENGEVKMNIVAHMDRTRMLVRPQGIELDDWNRKNMKELLEREGKPVDHHHFREKILAMPKSGRVFVDTSVGSEIAEAFYVSFLEAGIHGDVAAKGGDTGTIELYRDIRAAAERGKTRYEKTATVGADMSILPELAKAKRRKNEIVKVEAVLSGTLSYIFNTWDGIRPFSEVVEEAMKLGYAESDPRGDLSGMDVRGKLLSIAREAGYDVAEEDIVVSPAVPASLFEIGDETDLLDSEKAERFLKKLRAYDKQMEGRYDRAAAKKRVLRYLATFEDGKIKLGLQAVSPDHPAANLTGPKNMVTLHTIKAGKASEKTIIGDGAGAEETAQALFDDSLNIAEYIGR